MRWICKAACLLGADKFIQTIEFDGEIQSNCPSDDKHSRMEKSVAYKKGSSI